MSVSSSSDTGSQPPNTLRFTSIKGGDVPFVCNLPLTEKDFTSTIATLTHPYTAGEFNLVVSERYYVNGTMWLRGTSDRFGNAEVLVQVTDSSRCN